jgi:hypothetical protein
MYAMQCRFLKTKKIRRCKFFKHYQTYAREGGEINEKEIRTLDTLFVERPLITLP